MADYVITFGVEFLILVLSVLIFKLVNIRLDTVSFSEFTVSKRLNAFLIPLLMIGLGVSLPKFLPISSEKKQVSIYYTSLIIICSLFLFITVLFLFIPKVFSDIVFGDSFHKRLILANLGYVFSLMFHSCLYNYFRGKFNFKISGFMQAFNLGILPFVFIFVAGSIEQYFIYTGIFTIISCIVVSVVFVPLIKLQWSEIKENLNQIVAYGIQRMPGDVFLGLFLAVPSFIGTNYFSLTEGGQIAFCLSLFNITIAFMSPINIILLPRASKIVHEKDYTQLKSITFQLLKMSTLLGIFNLLVIFLFADFIIKIFNVSDIESTSYILKIIFTGVIGYSIFSVIRSIIDAFYNKARNSFNILLAFALFVFILFLLKYFNVLTLANSLISFSICVNFLGLITYLSVYKIKKLS